jgi:hypothetical protein
MQAGTNSTCRLPKGPGRHGTQVRHMGRNRILQFRGRSLTVTDWAAEVGMKAVTLFKRLRNGWPVERALTEPVAPRKPSAEWVRRTANPRKRGPKPGRRQRRDATTPTAAEADAGSASAVAGQ